MYLWEEGGGGEGRKVFDLLVILSSKFNPLKTSPKYTQDGAMGNTCFGKIKLSSTG